MRHRPKAAYVFLDRHTNHPTHHPYDAKDVPDIVGVEGPCDKWTQAKGKTPVPHYQIVTIVECKPRNKDGRSQLATYAFQLLEARPDLPGAYVAWAAPEGYQILWSDASGVVASEFTPWAQIEMLGAFVYSLYDPPSSHWLRDQSLKPMRAKHQPSDEVLWKIKLKEPRREFTKCQSIFVGNSWGRRTNVFKHGNGHDVAVIKDSYRDTKRRYLEEKLLDEIHEDGIFPGVVRPLFALPPEAKSGIELSKDKTLPRNVPTTAPLDDKKVSRRSTARVKARLVMGSYGESLNEAQSVLDILKAIYDAIEGMFSID